MRVTACPICEHDQLDLYLKVKDYSISNELFDLFQCKSCKFVFTGNPPAEKSIHSYYESEGYISHSDSQQGLINKLYHIGRRFMLNYKLSVVDNLPFYDNVIDIGSGTGYFVSKLENSGYHVRGVEPSERARKLSNDLNGRVPFKSVNEVIESKKEFEVATMWHVLEHMYDLPTSMEQIDDVLGSKGYLILGLPNRKSFDAWHYGHHWAGYDVPRHLYHFCPGDIDQMAKKHNYQVVSKKRLPLDALYCSLLSESYKKSHLVGQIRAGIIGITSYINSLISVNNCSSIIYVLQKM